MKKLNLSQTINTLANVGVIAGILFLIIELQQNNELLATNASISRFNVERERRNRVVENQGGIGEIIFKNNTGQPISEFEDFRLRVMSADTLETLQWQFDEVQSGRLPEESIDIFAWRVVWNSEYMHNIFDAQRDTLDSEFVNFIEKNIANQ